VAEQKYFYITHDSDNEEYQKWYKDGSDYVWEWLPDPEKDESYGSRHVIDDEGYSYLPGSHAQEVYKISPDGEWIWTFTEPTGPLRQSAVDDEGYSYTASLADEDSAVYKITPDGELEWRWTIEDVDRDLIAIDVDSNHYVYTGGWSEDGALYKIDPDGNLVWRFYSEIDTNVRDIVPMPEGEYVFFVHDTLYRLNADGEEEWSIETENGGESLSLDEDFLYLSDTSEAVKFDHDGEEQWRNDDLPNMSHGFDTAVDEDGYLHISGQSSTIGGHGSLNVLNPEGGHEFNLFFDGEYGKSGCETCYGIAVDPGEWQCGFWTSPPLVDMVEVKEVVESG